MGKWNIKRNIIFIASFGILVTLYIVSPKLVAATVNLPYLTTIYKSNSLTDIVLDILQKKGYKVTGVSISDDSKTFSIFVGARKNSKYYNDVKDDIKRETNQILLLKDYRSFNILVESKRNLNIDDLTDNENKLKFLIEREVQRYLEEINYPGVKVTSMLNPDNSKIFILLLTTNEFNAEKYFQYQSKIKKVVNDVLEKNTINGFEIILTMD